MIYRIEGSGEINKCCVHPISLPGLIHKTLEVFQIARLYDQEGMVGRIGEFMAK